MKSDSISRWTAERRVGRTAIVAYSADRSCMPSGLSRCCLELIEGFKVDQETESIRRVAVTLSLLPCVQVELFVAF